MLTTNVDVSDGLVNGARGEIVHFVTNNNNVTTILFKFDNCRVGLKAIQASPYRTTYTDAVPLVKYKVFPAKGKTGSENYPLTVSINTSMDNHNTQSARSNTR